MNAALTTQSRVTDPVGLTFPKRFDIPLGYPIRLSYVAMTI